MKPEGIKNDIETSSEGTSKKEPEGVFEVSPVEVPPEVPSEEGPAEVSSEANSIQ